MKMSEVRAIMAGSVWKILVRKGDVVAKGQEVIVLESMKMEIPLMAESDGTVSAVKVHEGDFVDDGEILLTVE